MSNSSTESPRPIHNDEARHLLILGGDLQGALNLLLQQFSVLQTRAQLLLTVATIALTITGFSGPRIAAAGAFQRYAMAGGLAFVLASMLFIIGGSLRIRWVTQFRAPAGGDDASLLASLPAADAGQNVRALTRAVPASSNGPSYRVEASVGSVPSSV